jgi:hypothetical protein
MNQPTVQFFSQFLCLPRSRPLTPDRDRGNAAAPDGDRGDAAGAAGGVRDPAACGWTAWQARAAGSVQASSERNSRRGRPDGGKEGRRAAGRRPLLYDIS